MKNRSVLIGGLVGLAVLAVLVYWLASPLFIDNTVDEAFPFEMPSQPELAAMSAEEMKALETTFMEAVPDEETLASLNEEEMAQVEEKVMEAAATIMSDTMVSDDMTTAEWVMVRQGQFMDADSFHQGSGSATIFQLGEERVLRFEAFSVTNGPDLHVILTTHPAPASRADVGDDYIDLGPLKGNMGNQNYEIDPSVDLSLYQSVVIYCVPFHVVFATATLN